MLTVTCIKSHRTKTLALFHSAPCRCRNSSPFPSDLAQPSPPLLLAPQARRGVVRCGPAPSERWLGVAAEACVAVLRAPLGPAYHARRGAAWPQPAVAGTHGGGASPTTDADEGPHGPRDAPDRRPSTGAPRRSDVAQLRHDSRPQSRRGMYHASMPAPLEQRQGLCSNCVRQLQCQRCGRWEHCQLGFVGYSRTGGLQQTAPIELPWYVSCPTEPHMTLSISPTLFDSLQLQEDLFCRRKTSLCMLILFKVWPRYSVVMDMKEKGVKPWSKTMFMVPNGEREGCQALVKLFMVPNGGW